MILVMHKCQSTHIGLPMEQLLTSDPSFQLSIDFYYSFLKLQMSILRQEKIGIERSAAIMEGQFQRTTSVPTRSKSHLKTPRTAQSKHILYCVQGIINMNRNGNQTNFSSYVCNGKKIKELFASTLNGITASVRCVSSIIVILNAKLTRLIAAHANKKTVRNKKARRVPFFASQKT